MKSATSSWRALINHLIQSASLASLIALIIEEASDRCSEKMAPYIDGLLLMILPAGGGYSLLFILFLHRTALGRLY